MDPEQIKDSIVSFRIKGTDMFTDPDLYLSLTGNGTFVPAQAQYKCFSWGEDVCSINGNILAKSNALFGAITCQFDC